MTAVACACGGATATAAPRRAAAAGAADILLHLPDIHCASCIASAEAALAAVPGVRAARVNLGLRRAQVWTQAPLGAQRLVDALTQAGITAAELDPDMLAGAQDRAGRDLLMRLGVAGFAMMNVMLLSVAVWSGATDTTKQLFHLLSAMIAVPATVFAARPFWVGALRSLQAGRLGMDVPISVAIVLATILSVVEALTGGTGHAWFDAALSLTFFLLAGRYLDQRGRAAARSAAQALAAIDVPRATRLTGEGIESVASSALRAGDRIRVLPGMRAPADGVVLEGTSDIDRSAMTGETMPGTAGPGDDVLAGETVLARALTLQVTRAGRDTTLARMGALVAQAEDARGAYLSLADRAARAYVPIVHLLALGAFVAWTWLTGDVRLATGIAVAVLIITCPCALGLAIPAVSVAATGRLFRAGLLVKERTALERLAAIDTVVFDKTGTLTTGAPQVVDAPAAQELAIAMGLAQGSAHPFAQAILAHGRRSGLTPAAVSDVRETPGFGMTGTWQGRTVSLGRGHASDGAASVLDLGNGIHHTIRYREALRDGAEAAVSTLMARGYRVLMLSGDGPVQVARIAGGLGIEDARAGLHPQDKTDVLAALKAEGAHVLMVGDGLNDTAALALADAAISPGSALDAPRNAADVVMLTDSLAGIPLALRTARQARWLMRQNIGIAALYNAIAIPVALAGLATPLLAALAMSLSSITVSLNAARIAR